MKDFSTDLLSPEAWLLRETGWDPQKQGINETIMSLGNGYMGSRAVLEEVPLKKTCGTYFAGVFDRVGAQVPELVNAPNPFDFRITCNGEKLDVAAMDISEHKRILDMRKGVLARRTVFVNSRKKKFDYQSLRFLSFADQYIGAMRIYLTPLDEGAEFEITNTIDTSVANMGLVTEGMKKHIMIEEVAKESAHNYMCVKTLEKGIHIAYATHLNVSRGRSKKAAPQSHRVFKIRLKKGETACFTKYYSFRTSRHVASERLKTKSLKTLKQSVKSGFENLMEKNSRAWERLWKNSDFDIVGDREIQKAIRFNIYHLLICGTDKGDTAGIGAKSLTGEGYRGHSFWDTEIFTLPFYIYTQPLIARHLLKYRHDRLGEAKKIALGKGYKGAMFPWESADIGEEATPTWHKDYDGKIRHIETGNQEHHITADIAFGVWNYFMITGDSRFMLDCGLEILLETARFWASRVEFKPGKKRYEINNVIGPDEFHEKTNNNAYTNMMAKWNLWVAPRLFKMVKKRFPSGTVLIAKRLGITKGEFAEWTRIRRSIANTAFNKSSGLIEQFNGFFRKKDIPIRKRDEFGIPLFPKNIKSSDLNDTQFIKQADVVLLMYLNPDAFSARQEKLNYDFYEKRTLHMSSLSPSIYAAMGLEVGEEEKAYKYFLASLYADLKDIHKNTHLGMHIACCGGNWQTLFHGFGGVSFRRDALYIDPKLPGQWKEMKFRVNWRGLSIRVEIDRERMRLRFTSKKRGDWVYVRAFGVRKRVYANTMYSFPKRKDRRLYSRDKTVNLAKGGVS
ncbi:glycoside hydrolase family 65 protein [Elusimicrobiota bacterium]